MILTINELLPNLNKKTVVTNGCFDILHTGHISLLKQAKSFGDILVVLVNDDNSVKRLKGNTRPINNINDRMLLLDELKCVDYVCAFSDDTPYEYISLIKPQVLVKGGDYEYIDQIVGYDIVTNNGGTVKTVQYVDSYSTTNLIDKIKK